MSRNTKNRNSSSKHLKRFTYDKRNGNVSRISLVVHQNMAWKYRRKLSQRWRHYHTLCGPNHSSLLQRHYRECHHCTSKCFSPCNWNVQFPVSISSLAAAAASSSALSSLNMYMMRSITRWEYPHSLSYQETSFTNRLFSAMPAP